MNDLVEMCQRSKTTDVAVMMMGIPENGHGHEGVEQALEQFGRIKAQLEPEGVRAGILIQSLIGHGERGRPIPDVPFQRIVGWDGTECRACFCPLDEGFLEHTRQVVQMMAGAAPAFLLVDDDVRLDNHYPARWACACQLHMAYFNQTTTHTLTREQLFTAMRGQDEASQILRDQWYESGEQSLLILAKEIRQAIDGVSRSIRCGKCVSGSRHELQQGAFARALAGKTRPLARLAHASYGASGYNWFAELMSTHQAQRSLMGDDIEYMCEADTFPQTYYSTSRKTLRGFVAGTLLASRVDIPYTWIPSTSEWVDSEWKGYADAMGQSEPFFRELRNLSRKTTWSGPSGICLRAYPLMPDPHHMPTKEVAYDLDWTGVICGRFGIPFTVNNPQSRAVMINGIAADALSTQEMRHYLSGGVLLDGPSALAFARRGLDKYMGVDVEALKESLEITEEITTDDPVNESSTGKHLLVLLKDPSDGVRLSIRPNGARVASWFTRNRWFMDPQVHRVQPAVTIYENELGGRVAIYAHSVSSTASISFLNSIRKQQLIGVLNWLHPLPAVAMTSGDAYMLFGHNDTDHENVAALFNLNPDDVEQNDGVTLRLNAPTSGPLLRLDDDGQWRNLSFDVMPGGIRLHAALRTMWPLIVRMPMTR
ncbi:MAG: hypothetical protein IT447_09135 [Phycisphaerales bacterium]|nr:hypothetical protein [Phycisphaerales bacterium]